MGSVEVFAILLVLCVAPSVFGDFNVVDYGAVGDGITDDTEAFKRTWAATCAARGTVSTLIVPRRTFLLNSYTFTGKCNATVVYFMLSGNLLAPTRDKFYGRGAWITFYKIDGLKFIGNGQMNGQGYTWWPPQCMGETLEGCNDGVVRPTLVAFESCNSLTVHGVKLVNSARNHVTVNGCKQVNIDNIHISSPAKSPNTDGINIGSSWGVQISDSFIESGDDCISFLPGSSNINVSHITCGPGHGISVGSIYEGDVEQVRVTNSLFKGTIFGARIKTKQGGSGHVRGITFADNWMQRVYNPIIIDQYYASPENQTAAVAISDVQFTNFHGMATGDLGIKLACSQTVPCTDIRLGDINLVSSTPHKKLSSYCFSVRGPHCPDCSPSVPCL